MQRQQDVEAAAVQRDLAVRAHEDIIVGDVLGIERPVVNARLALLREEVARAVRVREARRGDAVVVLGDGLDERGDLLRRLKLIAAVGQIIALVELDRQRQLQLRLRGKCLCRDGRVRHSRAAFRDDDNDRHKDDEDRDQRQQRLLRQLQKAAEKALRLSSAPWLFHSFFFHAVPSDCLVNRSDVPPGYSIAIFSEYTIDFSK